MTNPNGNLPNEEIEDLRQRIQHLEKIAETVEKVEVQDGNKGYSEKLHKLSSQLGSLEHKLLDAIGSGREHEKEIVLEVVADLRDIDQRLTQAVEEAVEHEAEVIGHELRDIAESYK